MIVSTGFLRRAMLLWDQHTWHSTPNNWVLKEHTILSLNMYTDYNGGGFPDFLFGMAWNIRQDTIIINQFTSELILNGSLCFLFSSFVCDTSVWYKKIQLLTSPWSRLTRLMASRFFRTWALWWAITHWPWVQRSLRPWIFSVQVRVLGGGYFRGSETTKKNVSWSL